MSDIDFCSINCLEAGAPLIATTPRTDVWLALEYSGRWGNKALQESDLPLSTKRYLAAFQDVVTNSRVVLIKREQQQASEGILCYLARSHTETPHLYQFILPDYESLEGIDLQQAATDVTLYPDHLTDDPIYLVCTNGKRDRCCAKFGLPVYQTLAKHHANVWQCTHLGGHRFAGNLVSLPDGAYYGRLAPQTALAALHEIEQGYMPLDYYRGTGCFEEPVQAAETLLRQHLDERKLSALTFVMMNEIETNQWAVRFEHQSGEITLRIIRQPAGYTIHDSCAAEKAVEVFEYHLQEMTQGA